MNLEKMRKAILANARLSPVLCYSANLAKRLSASNAPTKELIQNYFSAQPGEYLAELALLERINRASQESQKRAFVFVPCFNEEHNLDRLVDLYDAQTDFLGRPLPKDSYEICFVINRPEEGDSERLESDAVRFKRSVDVLLERRARNPNIHIVAKSFKEGLGSLGRARKYGLDYCLFRMLRQGGDLDSAVIISNEGDTREIPRTYLETYIDLFAEGRPKFVQGRVAYPQELIADCESLRLFTGCREAVHFGQGLFSEQFPYFDGIMPVGRNFAVSPRVYAQVGGIDPVRRKDTDDDMNFGTDIHVRLGEEFKSIHPVTLVTNPRREVMIVSDILAGKSEDSKKSYQNFHTNRAVYDSSYDDVIRMVREGIAQKVLDRNLKCELVNQYFQWVLISRYKAALCDTPDACEILRMHRDHEISYWEKEKALCDVFESSLQTLGPAKREERERKLVAEAKDWFNFFISTLNIQYACTQEGLGSRLL